jgi:hypothetical protein
MSLDKPRECNNCGLLIYWDRTIPGNPKNRPYDVSEPGVFHRCVGSDSRGHAPNPKIKTAPTLMDCKFNCGTQIILDTEDGKYKEGDLGGKEHKCPNLPTGYDNSRPNKYFSGPQKGTLDQIVHNPSLDNPQPFNLPTTPSKIETEEHSGTVKKLNELATILLGIAEQNKRIGDNLDLLNMYVKVIKDNVIEIREEAVTNKFPKNVKFETGATPNILKREEDIYDEMADVDDKTEVGSINGVTKQDEL